MKKGFLLAVAVFATLATNAQSLVGAWEWEETSAEGKSVRAVVIFSDRFQVATWYEAESGAFISTNGGFYEINGATVTEIPEFSSTDASIVGKPVSFEIEMDGPNKLNIVGTNRWATRIDAGAPGDLAGAWLMSGRKKNGTYQDRDTSRPRKTMKMLSGTRFQWIAYDTETKEFKGTGGGTYTTKNGKYTENLEFFSKDPSRVGAKLGFDFQLKAGDWIHIGKTSKGDPLYEVWSPRSE